MRIGMGRWLAAAGVAALLFAGPASAADDARVAELERQVRALQEQLAAMKSGAGGAPSAQIAELERQIQVLADEIEGMKLGEAASEEAGEGKYGLGPSASKVYGVKRGVSIAGYGEMLYENFEPTREDGAASGRTDQIDFLRAVLYFGYKFNDRILFNSEIEFEHASTNKNGEVSVEFANLDFLLRDEINVRVGMVLMPVGFLNELHEPPTFLGARRPYVEQVIIPSTWRENGAGVFGSAGPVSYRAYVVTGLTAFPGSSSRNTGFSDTGIREGRTSGSRSGADDFAVVGRLDWQATPWLLVGASAYTGGADQGRKDPLGQPIDAGVTLVEGHTEVRWRGLQARALYAETSIDDVPAINAVLTAATPSFAGRSVGERHYGWYGEAGYDVLTHAGETRQALIPYLRYERYDTQDEIPAGFVANTAQDVDVTTAGIAWKPIRNLAIKVDWNQIENAARTGVNQVNAAVGYMF